MEPRLKVEYLTIDELKPYMNNARAHHAEDVRAIVESIKEFGFSDPIGSIAMLSLRGGRTSLAKRR